MREVHGFAKQGTAFGYTKQRGLNIQLGIVSTPLAAAATGVGRLLAQTITTARAAGVPAAILARANSAYDGWAFVGTALRHNA